MFMYQPPSISNRIGSDILEKETNFVWNAYKFSGYLPVLPVQHSVPMPTSISGSFQKALCIFKPPVQHGMET